MSVASPARVAILLVSLALAACTSMPAQTFRGPTAAGKHYQHFLVYAAFTDLGAEGAFEHAMCAHLQAAGNTCKTMLQLAPPTTDQNSASLLRAAQDSHAQALLMIELADPGQASRRILADGRPGYVLGRVHNHRGVALLPKIVPDKARGAGRSTPTTKPRNAGWRNFGRNPSGRGHFSAILRCSSLR